MLPLLVMDFDGVLNFDASKSKYVKNSDTFGYVRKNTAVVYDSVSPGRGIDTYSSPAACSYQLIWSSELVNKLATLKGSWVWLTTWKDNTDLLNKILGLTDTVTLDWDTTLVSYAPGWNTKHYDPTHPGKYDALKEYVAAHDVPFVWVDDTATKHYRADDFNVPHLVVAPDPFYGITRSDFTKISDFISSLAN